MNHPCCTLGVSPSIDVSSGSAESDPRLSLGHSGSCVANGALMPWSSHLRGPARQVFQLSHSRALRGLENAWSEQLQTDLERLEAVLKMPDDMAAQVCQAVEFVTQGHGTSFREAKPASLSKPEVFDAYFGIQRQDGSAQEIAQGYARAVLVAYGELLCDATAFHTQLGEDDWADLKDAFATCGECLSVACTRSELAR